MAEPWEVWSRQYVFFAPRHWTSGLVAVIVESLPLRAGEIRPAMRAYALFKSGPRKPATPGDMSLIASGFYGFGDRGQINRLRLLIWILDGDWDCFGSEEAFQDRLASLLPWSPPNPAYAALMRERAGKHPGWFYGVEEKRFRVDDGATSGTGKWKDGRTDGRT